MQQSKSYGSKWLESDCYHSRSSAKPGETNLNIIHLQPANKQKSLAKLIKARNGKTVTLHKLNNRDCTTSIWRIMAYGHGSNRFEALQKSSDLMVDQIATAVARKRSARSHSCRWLLNVDRQSHISIDPPSILQINLSAPKNYEKKKTGFVRLKSRCSFTI